MQQFLQPLEVIYYLNVFISTYSLHEESNAQDNLWRTEHQVELYENEHFTVIGICLSNYCDCDWKSNIFLCQSSSVHSQNKLVFYYFTMLSHPFFLHPTPLQTHPNKYLLTNTKKLSPCTVNCSSSLFYMWYGIKGDILLCLISRWRFWLSSRLSLLVTFHRPDIFSASHLALHLVTLANPFFKG